MSEHDDLLIEEMVIKHGEKYRKLILDSLAWLNENESKWKLSRPIGRKTFLRGLISKATVNE